ncbi:sulfatase family protein [Fodinibius sediminis]|uniref:Arylsulfatase A n=1 Tax=Fodinibius sediminis TaxID=1214077 RepID=A0A521DPH3_9BACT|nr:sulfatase [Fodinibius sediminis]SMO73475.1 Arylsulfatase A [Fodinibius sediminis]
MRKYSLICLLACFLVAACESEPPGESPPNILFIMSDDHTSQAWGIYGSVLDSVARTPSISRLRDEGAKLKHVFATNSICTPSRAAILTGQYSHRNGVYTLGDTLDPARKTVAGTFQDHGYQTALIGKWHLKSRPSGFDHYNVLPGQGRYHDPILRDSSSWTKGGQEYQGFVTDVITDLSLQWLNERPKDKPFLLMTHFKATHEPFNYPERYDTLYRDIRMPEPESLYNFYPDQTERTFEGQVLEILGGRFEQRPAVYSTDDFSLEGLAKKEARSKVYQKFVKDFLRSGAAIDENIGRLLDYLDRAGMAENTIVIYTADQGYFMGEHGLFDKRIMYEESMQMPFVIRYPGEIEAGTVNDDIILNTDFAPLLMDYAGITPPEKMQGRSFRANLAGETPDDWRQSMYYRYWMHQEHRPAHLGIRTRRYKLIYFYGQPLRDGYGESATEPAWEFYDLKKDPRELHNAYGNPQYRHQIDSLKSELWKLKDRLGDSDASYPSMQSLLNRNKK